MELHKRAYEMIRILLNESKPITIKMMGQALGCSERTLRYELKQVRLFVEEYELKVVSKPKVGIWLEGREDDRKRLKKDLDFHEDQTILTPEERVNIILDHLLSRHKPVPMAALAEMLQVSRTTVHQDLKIIENWLKENDSGLRRLPRKGVEIAANERMKRQLLAKHLFEHHDGSELLLSLSDSDSLESKWARHEIERIEKGLNLKFAEASRIQLIYQLILGVQRIQQRQTIFLPDAVVASLRNTKEWEVICEMGKRLHHTFSIEWSDSEKGNFCLLIQGAKLVNCHQEFKDETLESMVLEFVQRMEILLHCDLRHDRDLMRTLMLHMRPALTRAKHGMEIRNPILSRIKVEYREIFQAAYRAKSVIEEQAQVHLREDEIGYLVLHIGAAMVRLELPRTRKLKVLVVCNAGIGTSKMLKSRLDNEFPNIEILDLVSASEIAGRELTDVDLILTTFPIGNEFPVPVIRISPLLTELEADQIEKEMKTRGIKRGKRGRAKSQELIRIIENFAMISDLEGLHLALEQYLGETKESAKAYTALGGLLERQDICWRERVKDWKAALRQSGEILLNRGAITENYIEEMIAISVAYQNYIIVAPGVAIAHAKQEAGAKRTAMSLLYVKNGIEVENQAPVHWIFTLSSVHEKSHMNGLSQLMSLIRKGRLDKSEAFQTSEQIWQQLKEENYVGRNRPS